MERERITHPAFGQISFSRINGGGSRFYGSDLPQDNYIEMLVSNSEIERELTQDRYYPTKRILKVRMTSNQFSELITTMNQGGGVPCTLEIADRNHVEPLPEIENRKDFVHRKFKDRMIQFAKTLKEKQAMAKSLIKKKTLSASDQNDLNFLIEHLTTEVANNVPFFMECFQESMDEVVTEAKMEVENAIQHKINVLGLTELQKQGKLLGNSETLNEK